MANHLESPGEVAARAGAPYHPAGVRASPPDPAEVDALEFFYWELTGFLVVRGAMGAQLLADANAVVDKHQPEVDYEGAARNQITGTAKMAGTGRPGFNNLMQLNEEERAPFVKMLAHPALVHRLNWMLGSSSWAVKQFSCAPTCIFHS